MPVVCTATCLDWAREARFQAIHSVSRFSSLSNKLRNLFHARRTTPIAVSDEFFDTVSIRRKSRSVGERQLAPPIDSISVTALQGCRSDRLPRTGETKLQINACATYPHGRCTAVRGSCYSVGGGLRWGVLHEKGAINDRGIPARSTERRRLRRNDCSAHNPLPQSATMVAGVMLKSKAPRKKPDSRSVLIPVGFGQRDEWGHFINWRPMAARRGESRRRAGAQPGPAHC